MKIRLLVALAAVGFGIASSAFAGCTHYTDILGNGSIRCSDGRSGYLYQDQLGNTSALVGERVNVYRDSSGRETARIGDERLNMNSDPSRNAPARARDYFSNSDPSSVAGRVNCSRDTFGMTTCR